MTILGIDPGTSGALALFGEDGALMAVADMPVVSVRVNGTQRARINAPELARILRDWGPRHAAVERVGPRGGPPKTDKSKPGAYRGDTPITAWNLGEACGIVLGVLGALGIPLTFVETKAWRSAAGIRTEPGMTYQDRKEASRQRALQLFPVQAAFFSRKKDSDRAEAAHMGRWLLAQERGG